MSFLRRLINRLSSRAGTAVEVAAILWGKRGFWRSLREQRPVTADGEPIPWITYPALDHLSRLDLSKATVLEYGAGNGSLWWAKRARRVVSVESRSQWVEEISRSAPPNLTIIAVEEGVENYAQAPLRDGGVYDVIVIDGLHRQACAQAALGHLRDGGLVVLDNSDWHPQIASWLRAQGLLQFDFHGFGPLNNYTWCTSLFVRGSTCVPLVDTRWCAGTYGNLEQIVSS